MTDTTNETELARNVHRATHDALAKYAAGLTGMNPETVARLLIGSATTVVAATLGPEYTAALLYSVADQLATPAGTTVN